MFLLLFIFVVNVYIHILKLHLSNKQNNRKQKRKLTFFPFLLDLDKLLCFLILLIEAAFSPLIFAD